jgi:hypothetical protein
MLITLLTIFGEIFALPAWYFAGKNYKKFMKEQE